MSPDSRDDPGVDPTSDPTTGSSEGRAPGVPHQEEGTDLARVVARGLSGRTRARNPARGGRGARGGPSAWEGDALRRSGSSTWSGSRPDERDPQSLDSGLERLVADRGWGEELRVHGVFARWAAIVGPDIAAHSTPEAYADGRLVVRAGSTAWATQLRLVAGSLVQRLNDELGEETVRVVDVLGPHGPSWRRGRWRVEGRGPRDTYG